MRYPLSAFVALCLAALPVVAQHHTAADGKIRLVRQVLSADALTAQRAIPAEVPVLRGVRLPLTQADIGVWPMMPPGKSAPPEVHAAARHVAERLACDGLVLTTAKVIELIGPQVFAKAGEDELLMLRGVGLPTDLLNSLKGVTRRRFGDQSGEVKAIVPTVHSAAGVVSVLSNLIIEEGEAAATYIEFHRMAPMRFFEPPALVGGSMVLSNEDGTAPARLVRLQLSKGGYWRGPGDGSAIDVAAQLVAALPEADFVISTSYEAQDEVCDAAAKWPLTRQGQITIVSTPWKPQQWAQDNGKPGFTTTPDGRRMAATLVPRYANRGEERTTLDPAESFTVAALGAANHTLVQTPLLFQGGNVMCVASPKGTVLLVGEAEVLRNRALGMSEAEVLAAFGALPIDGNEGRGAAEVVVLPAVSFHIDMEVCCRVHEGRVVAMINDDVAAARLIIASAARAFARGGVFDAKLADEVGAAAAAREDDRLIDLITPAVSAFADAGGQYPLGVAEKLSAGHTDSGVGNLERFLLAMDILAAKSIKPEELPRDPAARTYIQALQHRAADRVALRLKLAELGWRVVPVPSLSDESRSVCYVNGFHLPGKYLMPAYGGIYADVDSTVAKTISKVFDGKIEIVPILCGETQRRLGAIHCAASIYCWN